MCHPFRQQSVEPSVPSKPSLLSGCLWRKHPKTRPVENSVLPPVDTQNYCSISHASCGRTELDLEQEQREEEEVRENNQNDMPPVRMSCEVKDLSNGRTHTSLRPVPHLHINNSRFRSMHAREKKATQMLAIVLGELSLHYSDIFRKWKALVYNKVTYLAGIFLNVFPVISIQPPVLRRHMSLTLRAHLLTLWNYS